MATALVILIVLSFHFFPCSYDEERKRPAPKMNTKKTKPRIGKPCLDLRMHMRKDFTHYNRFLFGGYSKLS